MGGFSRLVMLALCAVTASGCSINRLAVNQVGDALAGGNGAYAVDDDPELVGAALPFGLKLIESLLAQSPEHRGMLTAAASGFTQYAYGFVQMPAEQLEDTDLERAWAEKDRARRLYLRARDYGLRGLAVGHPGFATKFQADPEGSLEGMGRLDVELLYWTAAAWGAAVGLGKDDPDLVGDLPRVEKLADRALALDPDFGAGALHGFMITYEMIRPGAEGDAAERATWHYQQAVQLSHGLEAGPHVSFADSVCRDQDDRECFRTTLNAALAIDVGQNPNVRLANTLMQRRARWLLGRIDRLFMPGSDEQP